MSTAFKAAVPLPTQKTSLTQQQSMPLRDSVKHAIENYFVRLEGQSVSELYQFVLTEIEEPLFQVVMRFARNNQSLAAEWLGLSRGTLRKKLAEYDLL